MLSLYNSNANIGASKVALDVLAGVTSDYLLNVGRTMRFMCDKYASKMTPEVIFSLNYCVLSYILILL